MSDSGEGRGGGKGPGTGCLLFFLEEPGELSAPGFSSTHRPQNSETHPPLGEDSAFIAEYHILPARTREMIFFFSGGGNLVVPFHYLLLTVWSWMKPLPSLGLSFPNGCYRPLAVVIPYLLFVVSLRRFLLCSALSSNSSLSVPEVVGA